jgi:hypothetical protein
LKARVIVMMSTSKLLANPAVRRRHAVSRTLFALAVTTGLLISPLHAQQATTADRDAVLKAFTGRAEAYVTLRKKLEKGLPPMKDGAVSTGAAETHQSVLGTRLREARAGAKQGDIFGDATPHFRQILEQDMKTRSGSEEKAVLDEVPAKSPPAVNASYPEQAALATVPPLLLVNLPRLPDGLEYRFMGRDLILRDRNANLVVDFIPGALPAARR